MKVISRQGMTRRCGSMAGTPKDGGASTRLALLLRCGGRRRRRAGDRRGAIEDRVEQELEGAVRLRAEGDFRTDQKHFALAEFRFNRSRPALEIVLTPRPA